MSAVLFFTQISDPIVPFQSTNPGIEDAGHEANDEILPETLPKGRNYLAIKTESIQELLDRNDGLNEGKLAYGAYWHCESLLGQTNFESYVGFSDPLQRIIARRSQAKIPAQLLKDFPEGALIFRPDTGLRDLVGSGANEPSLLKGDSLAKLRLTADDQKTQSRKDQRPRNVLDGRQQSDRHSRTPAFVPSQFSMRSSERAQPRSS